MRDRSNEYISALTHLAGFGLSIAGLVLLVYRGAVSGSAWHVVSFAVFGTSLLLAYGMSVVYHSVALEHRRKAVLRRYDHAMIYILIAGTYTPVTLLSLRGGWGWSLFGVVWGLALAGVVWKLADWRLPQWLSGVLYVLMGWLITIAVVPLLHAIALAAFWWLLGGGLAYSVGVIFFGLETVVKPKRYFGMHEVFHLFVMLGSFCHWWMMFWYFV